MQLVSSSNDSNTLLYGVRRVMRTSVDILPSSAYPTVFYSPLQHALSNTMTVINLVKDFTQWVFANSQRLRDCCLLGSPSIKLNY